MWKTSAQALICCSLVLAQSLATTPVVQGQELAKQACEAWQTKRVNATTLHVKLSGTATFPKGSHTYIAQSGRKQEFIEKDAGKVFCMPKEDLKLPMSAECFTDFTQNLMCWNVRIPFYSLNVEDFETSNEAYTISKSGEMHHRFEGTRGFPVTQLDRYLELTPERGAYFFAPSLNPLLFSQGLVLAGESNINNRLAMEGLSPETFTAEETVAVADQPYTKMVILKSDYQGMVILTYTLPEFNWAILKYECIVDESINAVMLIDYNEDFTIPQSWTWEIYNTEDQSVFGSYHFQTDLFKTGEDFEEKLFEPVIEEGDVIRDLDTGFFYKKINGQEQRWELSATAPAQPSQPVKQVYLQPRVIVGRYTILSILLVTSLIGLGWWKTKSA